MQTSYFNRTYCILIYLSCSKKIAIFLCFWSYFLIFCVDISIFNLKYFQEIALVVFMWSFFIWRKYLISFKEPETRIHFEYFQYKYLININEKLWIVRCRFDSFSIIIRNFSVISHLAPINIKLAFPAYFHLWIWLIQKHSLGPRFPQLQYLRSQYNCIE